MPGTQRPDVCRQAGDGPPTGIRDGAQKLGACFAGAQRPDAVLAHSPYVANLRHLWVLAYVNGTPGAVPATPCSEIALRLARVMARRSVQSLRQTDIDDFCLHLKAQPALLQDAGVMYVSNMLWCAIWWHDMPAATPPPSDLKILDLFHLDSLRRAAQVPELRAAALTVFAQPFDLRPGESVLAQYQVPTSTSAKLSVLQVLELVRPAPYVVGLANSITFDDLSAILKDKPQAMEALVFAMFRARARSLVDGFDFADCVWSAAQFETRAGPEAARRAAQVKPIVLRWDVGRYHVCDQRGEFVGCDTAQKAISVWRHLLRTQYDDVVDNRLSFAGLMG